MRTFLVACGNPLRGDDGVAHAALRLIAPAANRRVLSVRQWMPELAEEIAAADRVVFLDADTASERVVIEPVDTTEQHSPLTHVLTPAEIVNLSGALFGFTGEAFLCRIPARDFSPGEALPPDTLQFARQAADKIRNLI
jgi:hydrogenase maturation protease